MNKTYNEFLENSNVLIYGLNFIGDTIFYLNVIEQITRIMKNSNLYIASGDKGGIQILKRFPNIKEIIELKGNFIQKTKIIKKLNINFDISIIINTSFESALISFFK